MYEYDDLFTVSCSSSDFYGHSPEIPTILLPESLPAPPPPPPLSGGIVGSEFDSVREALAALKSEVCNSSSCCSSYGSASSVPSLMQRSVSSHSFPKDGFHHHYQRHPIFSYLDESSREVLDSENGRVRKVFSTGDIQTINLVQHSRRSISPLSHEHCATEGTSKVRCYSAEERKERIERYRSKRSQRNFTKKIKYACRKTLADSRPRIRGRFARNEESGESCQSQWTQMGGEVDEDDNNVWANFLNAFSTSLISSSLMPGGGYLIP